MLVTSEETSINTHQGEVEGAAEEVMEEHM